MLARHLIAKLFLVFLLLISNPGPLLPSEIWAQSHDPASPFGLSDQALLDQAKILLDAHQVDKALETLDVLLEREPDPAILQQVYFLQAAAFRVNNHTHEAASTLEQLLEEFPVSPLAQESRLLLAELYVTSDKPERALSLLHDVLNVASNPLIRREALQRIRTLYRQQGQLVRAVATAIEELALAGPEDRAELRTIIQDLILTEMTEPALEQLIERYPARYPGDLATIRLIELHTARGDEVLAERDIRAFLQRFPNHPYAQTAMALLQSFMSKIKVHPYVLAAVLPFSGPLKAFGTESLNGIRLAIADAREQWGMTSIGLVVKDTASPVGSLRYDLAQMITEFAPLAVIGPLLTREARTIAVLADQYHIPFITPSATLADIRSLGSYWFSTAVIPPLQIDALVHHAITQLHYRRFCIVHPQTGYGQEMARLFQEEAVRQGGEIVAVESYTDDETDFATQLQRLKAADLRRSGQLSRETVKTGYTRWVYTPGFDAVFLPGDPVHVALLAAQLAFYDINVPLLGSDSWYTSELLHWANDSVEGGIFPTGFFGESPDPGVQRFVHRYRARFHSDPTVFAAQAYDAALLILDTIRQGARTGSEIREQLLRRYDLPALNGLAVFRSNRLLERKIYLIQVSGDRFVQIN